MGRRGPFQGRRVPPSRVALQRRRYYYSRRYPVQRARAREGKARPSASWFHFGLTPLLGPTTPRIHRRWLPLRGAKRPLWGSETPKGGPFGVPPKGRPQKWGNPIFGPPGVPRGAPRGGGTPPWGGPKGGVPPFWGGLKSPLFGSETRGFRPPCHFGRSRFWPFFANFGQKRAKIGS